MWDCVFFVEPQHKYALTVKCSEPKKHEYSKQNKTIYTPRPIHKYLLVLSKNQNTIHGKDSVSQIHGKPKKNYMCIHSHEHMPACAWRGPDQKSLGFSHTNF